MCCSRSQVGGITSYLDDASNLLNFQLTPELSAGLVRQFVQNFVIKCAVDIGQKGLNIVARDW